MAHSQLIARLRKAPAEELIAALNDRSLVLDESTRRVILWMLGRTRDPVAGVEALKIFREGGGSPDLRMLAADIVGDAGLVRGIPDLLGALESGTTRSERLGVIRALGKLKADEATQAIAQVLREDEDTDVQFVAVQALLRIGTRTAIAATVPALHARRRYIALLAAEGLVERGGDSGRAEVEHAAATASGWFRRRGLKKIRR